MRLSPGHIVPIAWGPAGIALFLLAACAPPVPVKDNRDVARLYRPEATSPTAALKEPETLDDLLAWGARNNPDLRGAFFAWRAALEKVPQVEALPDPKIAYGVFLQEVETRVGPQRMRFGVSQTIPWPGERSVRGHVAAARADGALARYFDQRDRLRESIQKQWAELRYIERALAIARANLNLLENLEGALRARLRGGGALVDLTRLQIEMGRLENQIRSLEDGIRPLNVGLNALLGREPDADLPQPTAFDTETSSPVSTLADSLSLDQNAALIALENELRAAEHAQTLAAKESMPDFTIGADVIETGKADMAGLDDNGKDPVILSLALNVPLNRRKYSALRSEAAKNRQSVQERLTGLRQRLQSEMETAQYHYRDAERRRTLYREILIPKAREAFELALEALETGQSDFQDLVETERAMLEFELAAERAQADRVQRAAEIARLTGGGQ